MPKNNFELVVVRNVEVEHLQDRERELVEGARLSRGEQGVHSGSEGVRGRQQGPLG